MGYRPERGVYGGVLWVILIGLPILRPRVLLHGEGGAVLFRGVGCGWRRFVRGIRFVDAGWRWFIGVGFRGVDRLKFRVVRAI